MKKLFFTLFFSTAALLTFAQSVTFGIKGGADFAKINETVTGGNLSISTGSLTTFSVGGFVDIKFGNLSIQPAIIYAGKGGEVGGTTDDQGDNTTLKLSLYYVEIPIDLVYHVSLPVGSIYFGAGPYAATGVSGNAKEIDNGETTSRAVKFGSNPDTDDIKSSDFGANIIAGFQFKNGLILGINYDVGIADISPQSAIVQAKNNVFGLSIGYAFK